MYYYLYNNFKLDYWCFVCCDFGFVMEYYPDVEFKLNDGEYQEILDELSKIKPNNSCSFKLSSIFNLL